MKQRLEPTGCDLCFQVISQLTQLSMSPPEGPLARASSEPHKVMLGLLDLDRPIHLLLVQALADGARSPRVSLATQYTLLQHSETHTENLL